jgi:hypothetical protein
MNRKLVALNIALLVLAGWLFWMLRLKWIELHQHEHTVLALSPEVRRRLMPPSPMPMFKPMSAADYNDVAQKMLFAKDRNPNVILDPKPAPPPPPPPPPMPALPAYYGEMLFGDPVVVLRLPKGAQKNYHAGDKVGPFQLVSFTRDKIVFDWDGKTVERKPEELREKEPVEEAAAAPAPPAPANNPPGGRSISQEPKEEPKGSDKLGKDNGNGVKMCVAGDKSPAGTVEGNYKKMVTSNMFGETCMWVLVNP